MLFTSAHKSFSSIMLDQNYVLKISTIAMAEYCVRGKMEELPLRYLQVLPFTDEHVRTAAEYAKFVFAERIPTDIVRRVVIPNDTMMFAQAEVDNANYYITADSESLKVYNLLLSHEDMPRFKVVDIRSQDYRQAFSALF
jgi:hypothetical protein